MEHQPKWYKQHCLKIHKKKLGYIKGTATNRIDFNRPESLDIIPLHHELNYLKRKRNSIEIFHENQQILKRICEISGSKNRVKSQPELRPLHQKLQNQKNYELISKNISMLDSISHIKSELSSQKLAQDYQKTLKLKELLKKKPKFSSFLSKSQNKLPPIERSPNSSQNHSHSNQVPQALHALQVPQALQAPQNSSDPALNQPKLKTFKASPTKHSSPSPLN